MAFYGVAPSPSTARSGARRSAIPGYVVRLDPTKPNPSETALAEVYEVPAPGYGPRGMDIDSQERRVGAAVERPPGARSTAASARSSTGRRSRPASIARKAGRSIRSRDPKLTGDTGSGSAEASYYTWVDQHDTLGLGKDVPFATGNQNESMIALKDGKMVNLVVPYPMGFYAKTIDGRIDDAERRLERPRHLGDDRQPHAVPRRRRQGQRAEAREVPAAPRSAREVSEGAAHAIR